jgi:hypothetical protein
MPEILYKKSPQLDPLDTPLSTNPTNDKSKYPGSVYKIGLMIADMSLHASQIQLYHHVLLFGLFRFYPVLLNDIGSLPLN